MHAGHLGNVCRASNQFVQGVPTYLIRCVNAHRLGNDCIREIRYGSRIIVTPFVLIQIAWLYCIYIYMYIFIFQARSAHLRHRLWIKNATQCWCDVYKLIIWLLSKALIQRPTSPSWLNVIDVRWHLIRVTYSLRRYWHRKKMPRYTMAW